MAKSEDVLQLKKQLQNANSMQHTINAVLTHSVLRPAGKNTKWNFCEFSSYTLNDNPKLQILEVHQGELRLLLFLKSWFIKFSFLNDQRPPCREGCNAGCFCDSGFILNVADGRCINPKNCKSKFWLSSIFLLNRRAIKFKGRFLFALPTCEHWFFINSAHNFIGDIKTYLLILPELTLTQAYSNLSH